MRLDEISNNYYEEGYLHLDGWGDDDTKTILFVADEYGYEVLQTSNPTILKAHKYDPITEIFRTHLRKDLGVNFEDLS